MSYKTGCLICGFALTYLSAEQKMLCEYCSKAFVSDACCVNHHYVCDRCHSLTANDLIEQYSRTTLLTDPLRIAATLMKNPQIKVHGPEHHFLVPAALLAAWYNRQNNALRKDATIIMARRRAEAIKEGFCGSHGACGAAIGSGIFISIMTGATQIAKDEWRLANLMSSVSLKAIAENGGPRCCKRDTFLSITAAVIFLKEHFEIELPLEKRVKCEFAILNQECLGEGCQFSGA